MLLFRKEVKHEMNNVKSEKTNINPNLHIPTTLIKNYRLSDLALLVYGELWGLYNLTKNNNTDIRTLRSSISKQPQFFPTNRGLNWEYRQVFLVLPA